MHLIWYGVFSDLDTNCSSKHLTSFIIVTFDVYFILEDHFTIILQFRISAILQFRNFEIVHIFKERRNCLHASPHNLPSMYLLLDAAHGVTVPGVVSALTMSTPL